MPDATQGAPSFIQPKPPARKTFSLKKIPLYAAIMMAVTLSLFSYGVITSDDPFSRELKKIVAKPFQFLSFGGDKPLKGEARDRINILLLGIGGQGHEGAYLTDTIIVASYKPSLKRLAMLSIPRDLVVNLKQFGWRKINSANAFGEILEQGKGPELAASVTSDMLGQPIDYYVRLDFSGFKKLIDQFEGIDIYVENDLDDYRYPIEGRELVYPIEDRFEHLFIAKGWQHMDGETALKYSRSRHGLGAEGSDFARSRRQQKVILAVKDKVLNYRTIFQPSKIKALFSSYQENVATNLEFWEMAKILMLAREFDNKNITNKVLDDSPNGVLEAQNFNGMFILEPKIKDYSGIKKIAGEIFGDVGQGPPLNALPANGGQAPEDAPVAIAKEPEKKAQEAMPEPTIDLLNGTFIANLAKSQEKKLQNLGLKISKRGNAPTRNHSQTLLYQADSEKFLEITEKIAKTYSIDQILEKPEDIETESDFILILGTDVKL